MKDVYVGKIVSTHGIKGEVKILSDFEYKDKVFKVGNKLVIDGDEFEIKSYRHHKNFEMVTLNDYRDINEVLFLMKKKVYIEEELIELSEDEILAMSCAIVEAYRINGSKLYATKYVEPGMQDAAIPTYPINAETVVGRIAQ